VVLLGVKYLALRVPFMVSQLLPVALLAGVIFGFSLLNRTEEVVALQALGISRARLTVPVLMLAMMVTLFDFGLSEGIVPTANRRAYSLLMMELKRRPLSPQDNGEPGSVLNKGFWWRNTTTGVAANCTM